MRGYLARQYVKIFPKDLFIGVTGSIGKTTCIQACFSVLSSKFKTLATVPNLEPRKNIPNTILKLTPKIKKVILEMGIDYPSQADFYLSFVKPETYIVTKLSYSNCEYLNLEEKIEEIAKLINQLDDKGIVILNFDDPLSRKLAENCPGSVIYFGTNPQNCTVWADNIKIEDYKTTFELNLGVERVKVNFPILGLHQIYPALATATLGVINNIPLTRIKLSLESIKPVEHQMQVLSGPNNSIVLDDTLECSPATLAGAIDTLLQISARRRILVLGEMRNLGEHCEKLHREIAQKIIKDKIDLCFLGQGDVLIIADELKSLGFWEERVEGNLSSSQIVGKLLKTLGKGDVVLIKGAPALRLDEVVKRIAKKGNN